MERPTAARRGRGSAERMYRGLRPAAPWPSSVPRRTSLPLPPTPVCSHARRTPTAPRALSTAGVGRAPATLTSASRIPTARAGKRARVRTSRSETRSTRMPAWPRSVGSTRIALAIKCARRLRRTCAAEEARSSRAIPPPTRAASMQTAAPARRRVATNRPRGTGRASRNAPWRGEPTYDSLVMVRRGHCGPHTG